MCNETPFTVEKFSVSSFRRELSPGWLDHQASANPPTQLPGVYGDKERATTNQRDRRIIRERERKRERERERDEYSFAYTAAPSLSYFVAELISSADIIRKLTSAFS